MAAATAIAAAHAAAEPARASSYLRAATLNRALSFVPRRSHTAEKRQAEAERVVERFFPNGDKYVGNWSGGVPHGSGTYTWADGSLYEGEWSKGNKHGQGLFIWPSGAKYMGEWVQGSMQGVGNYSGVDESFYTGNWAASTKHGLGRKRYPNGDTYEGFWSSGAAKGPGRYVWHNGNEYVGEWHAGTMSGFGTFTWASGDSYEGEWEGGFEHGHGIFTWADGACYEGTWSQGLKDGKGVFYPSGSRRMAGSSGEVLTGGGTGGPGAGGPGAHQQQQEAATAAGGETGGGKKGGGKSERGGGGKEKERTRNEKSGAGGAGEEKAGYAQGHGHGGPGQAWGREGGGEAGLGGGSKRSVRSLGSLSLGLGLGLGMGAVGGSAQVGDHMSVIEKQISEGARALDEKLGPRTSRYWFELKRGAGVGSAAAAASAKSKSGPLPLLVSATAGFGGGGQESEHERGGGGSSDNFYSGPLASILSPEHTITPRLRLDSPSIPRSFPRSASSPSEVAARRAASGWEKVEASESTSGEPGGGGPSSVEKGVVGLNLTMLSRRDGAAGEESTVQELGPAGEGGAGKPERGGRSPAGITLKVGSADETAASSASAAPGDKLDKSRGEVAEADEALGEIEQAEAEEEEGEEVEEGGETVLLAPVRRPQSPANPGAHHSRAESREGEDERAPLDGSSAATLESAPSTPAFGTMWARGGAPLLGAGAAAEKGARVGRVSFVTAAQQSIGRGDALAAPVSASTSSAPQKDGDASSLSTPPPQASALEKSRLPPEGAAAATAAASRNAGGFAGAAWMGAGGIAAAAPQATANANSVAAVAGSIGVRDGHGSLAGGKKAGTGTGAGNNGNSDSSSRRLSDLLEAQQREQQQQSSARPRFSASSTYDTAGNSSGGGGGGSRDASISSSEGGGVGGGSRGAGPRLRKPRLHRHSLDTASIRAESSAETAPSLLFQGSSLSSGRGLQSPALKHATGHVYKAAVIREYVQGVLVSETLKDAKVAQPRRRGPKNVGAKAGEKIYKGHRSYDLMVALQHGIRYSAGKLPAKPLGSDDFGGSTGVTIRLKFPREGSQVTPPHQAATAFKWKDYCPRVFRQLRSMFGVDPSEYMLSLGGADALRELSSPGKSGSMFFLSHDDKFMVKTMRKAEVKVLLQMLPAYYEHVQQHKDTLLTKFFGLHRVKLHRGRKVRFVVMGNLLMSGLRIHRRWDLKGSSQGRGTDKVEIEETTTLKDLDLDLAFHLHGAQRAKVLRQIEADCRFLEVLRIMDYSLLLGCHFRATNPPPPLVTLSDVKAEEEERPEEPPSALSEQDAKPGAIVAVADATGGSTSHCLEHERSYPLKADQAGCMMGHGMAATALRVDKTSRLPIQNPDLAEAYEVIVYFGIIDILQEYDVSKKLEHFCKALQYDGSSISAVDPNLYAQRFIKFASKVFPDPSRLIFPSSAPPHPDPQQPQQQDPPPHP